MLKVLYHFFPPSQAFWKASFLPALEITKKNLSLFGGGEGGYITFIVALSTWPGRVAGEDNPGQASLLLWSDLSLWVPPPWSPSLWAPDERQSAARLTRTQHQHTQETKHSQQHRQTEDEIWPTACHRYSVETAKATSVRLNLDQRIYQSKCT